MWRRSSWISRISVVGAAGAVWAALWFTRPPVAPLSLPSPASPQPGTAPIVTGDSGFCPGWEDSAYASTRTSLPPNYPGSAPAGRPVRCFASQAEAVRAGFRPAPTPPGDVIVDGVYLVPTSVSLGAVCARAAAKLRYAVPCPSMLPNPAPAGPSPRCGAAVRFQFPDNPSCLANVREFDYGLYDGSYRSAPALYVFLLEQGVFAVPPSWISTSGIVNSGLVIVGAPESATGALRSMLCAGGTVTATAVVNGRHATVRQCHNSSNDTTRTLSWTQHGIAYEVAVFGPASSTESLVEAVARGIQLVSPA